MTVSAYLAGEVDTPMVFSSPLTDAQSDWMYDNKATYNELVASTHANNPGAASVEAAWSMDEHTGVRMDSSGNGLHLVPGGSAKAVTFASADSEYAEVDVAAVTAVGFTIGGSIKTGTTAAQIAAWIGNKDSNDEYTRIGLSAGGDAILSRQAAGGAEDVTTGANIDDDAWHWMAAVITAAADVDLYVDAVAAVNDTTSVAVANFDRTAIGAHRGSTPASYMDGEQDNWWAYDTALTSANLTWLRTGGTTGGPATYYDVQHSNHADNPGTGNLVAWWKLNESDPSAGATLVNVHNPGTLDLTTASGGAGPVSATGLVVDLPTAVAGTVSETAEVEDRATEFASASSQYAEANTAAISDYGTTIAAWLNSGTTAEQTALWIGDKDADDVFVRIGIDGSGNAFLGRSASGGSEDVTTGANIDDGEWHLVLAVLTAADDVDLYVDSDAAVNDTTSVAIANFDRTSIGRHGGSTPAAYFDGKLDEAMIFGSALSSAQRTTIYNSGVGMLNDDALLPTASHYWSMSKNNASGAGEDLVGSLDLTLANSPTDAAGIPAGQALHGLVSLVDGQANSRNFTQATLSKRPEAVRVTDDGSYALRTDGVDDVMQTAAFAAVTQPTTVFLVATVRDQSADQVLIDGIAAGNEHALQVKSADDTLRVDAGTAADTTHDIDYGNTHVWLVVFNGASTKVYRDGGTAQTVSAGAESVTGLTLGAMYDAATSPADADYHQLIVNDGTFTTAQLNTIGRKLAADHGLSWSAIA